MFLFTSIFLSHKDLFLLISSSSSPPACSSPLSDIPQGMNGKAAKGRSRKDAVSLTMASSYSSNVALFREKGSLHNRICSITGLLLMAYASMFVIHLNQFLHSHHKEPSFPKLISLIWKLRMLTYYNNLQSLYMIDFYSELMKTTAVVVLSVQARPLLLTCKFT